MWVFAEVLRLPHFLSLGQDLALPALWESWEVGWIDDQRKTLLLLPRGRPTGPLSSWVSLFLTVILPLGHCTLLKAGCVLWDHYY